MKPVYQRLQLYELGTDAYIFVPFENSNEFLTVSRSSADIALNTTSKIPSSARRLPQTVFGIIGLISLSLSDYLIILTSRELRGTLSTSSIYQALDFDILPINPRVSAVNPSHPVEGHLLSLLRSHFRNGLFWLSYDWDLTRKLQSQHPPKPDDAYKGLWELADDRFFWNKFLQSRLIDLTQSSKYDLSNYILPIMYGTFDMRPMTLNGRRMQLVLISRRSRHRAGTRYFRRGIDENGHVANFNETEQIVLIDSPSSSPSANPSEGEFPTKLSYVQIRGSVPIYWTEVNTLRYVPDMQIMELSETNDAMRRHFQSLVHTYGDQILVSLVNQRGHERPLKEAFERHIAEVSHPHVHYEYFDFHTECKNMRWDRIGILMDRLQDKLESQGFYEVYGDQAPRSIQNGVVRTNCMDNLDRTGVVQAALGKRALNLQLTSLGILPQGASIDDYPEISQQFREIWADHADLISKAYAGSAALKSDYTRTNKRTRVGALEDGLKSTIRYLKNNYFDGPRQDAFDLVTGAWTPRNNSSLFFLVNDPRPLITRAMPVIVSFSLFMICAGVTLPRTSNYSLLYYFAIWFSVILLAGTYILIHGLDYVSWPKLVAPNAPPGGIDVVYYEGPGFKESRHGRGFGSASSSGRLGPSRVSQQPRRGGVGGGVRAQRPSAIPFSQRQESEKKIG